MPKWIASLVGKILKGKIGLKEDSQMDDKKKWWQSRTVWLGVVTVVIGTYNSVRESLAPAIGFTLPEIPDFVFAILGGLVGYTRLTTTKTIG